MPEKSPRSQRLRGFFFGIQTALETLALHGSDVEMGEIVEAVGEEGLGPAIVEEGSELLRKWWAQRTLEDGGSL